MNRLIAFLENENDLSVARLKRLYRLLSKKTHPEDLLTKLSAANQNKSA